MRLLNLGELGKTSIHKNGVFITFSLKFFHSLLPSLKKIKDLLLINIVFRDVVYLHIKSGEELFWFA